MTEIRTRKLQMREKYLAIRDEISPEGRSAADSKIVSRLLSSITYRHADDVLLYFSSEKEVDTRPIFEAAISSGKRVAFPSCNDDNTMTFRYVNDYAELIERPDGSMEAAPDAPLCTPNNFSLLIVPALVFDKAGFRIGYGKGFYDRYLSTFEGVSIGLCYQKMLLPEVPRGRFDRHVDVIITEKGVYAVNALQ